jgi:periplasmic glucans biosynthesis protein
VVQTRRGRSYGGLAAGEDRFVIDFVGPALRAAASVEPVVTVPAGAALREATAYRNDVTGGWRLTLRVQRDPATLMANAPPLELRAFLRSGNDTLTETWTYLHPVQRR